MYVLSQDSDGCLYPWNAMVGLLFEEKWPGGHYPTFQDWQLRDWYYPDGSPVTSADFRAVWFQGVRDGRVFREGTPIPGSQEAMWELTDAGIYVRVVTDKGMGGDAHLSYLAMAHTAAWLSSHDFPPMAVTFDGHKDLYPANAAVDDKPFGNWAHTKLNILFGQPWNVEHQHHNVERIDSWPEVTKRILTDRDMVEGRER